MKRASDAKSPHYWHNILAGCTAGAGARFVVAPLDLIRIRLQVQSKKPAFLHVQEAYSQGGIRALFRGNLAATYLWMGYSAVSFTMYARTSDVLRTTDLPKSAVAFLGGAFSGVCATVATYPLDTCRTAFAARSSFVDPNAPQSMVGFAKNMYRQRGIQGFFVGIGSAVIQIIPYMGLNFAIYEILSGTDKTILSSGAAGAVSGSISKLIVYPFDTIKKRLQVDAYYDGEKGYRSMVDCFVKTVKYEGFPCLFRGWIPTVMKNSLATGISFSLYTLTLSFLGKLQPSAALRARKAENQIMTEVEE